MAKLYDLARMTTATTGTGTITLGSAVSGYLSFTGSGVADGDVVAYGIIDGANSECGFGTFTLSGTTLTRNVTKSTNSNAAISLSGNAQVMILARAEDLLTQPITPGGRLTLATATPVMTTSQSAKTTVFYTPYIGAYVPLYDGGSFVPTLFSEVSQTTTDTTKSPAAVAAESVYDVFVWNDAGTLRATRGPVWTKAATVTISNSTPATITWTGHGLSEQMPVVFTTTGALPTGLTAGTIYYVGKGPVANAFNVATTAANASAGIFVATSSAGSGVHTGTNATTARGTGAGTSELQMLNGIWTNKNAITNGPAANKGTYVGTIRSNASSQIDFTYGGAASGGSAGALNVWNCYNRVIVGSQVIDNGTNYTYSSSALRQARASTGNQFNFVVGLSEDAMQVSYCTFGACAAAANAVNLTGIGLDATGATTGGVNGIVAPASTSLELSLTCTASFIPVIGAHFVTAIERSDGTNLSTFAASGGTNALALNYKM